MRLRVIKFCIIFFFSILFIDLFYMQIMKGPEYFRQSENNRIRLVPEEAPRGIIYDRNNIPLAQNRLAFDVVVVPQEVKNSGILFSKLGKFLNLGAEALAEDFYSYFTSPIFSVMLAKNVPRSVAFLIEQERWQLPGVYIKPRIMRYYGYGNSVAHILGYIGKMSETEYPDLKKYGYRIEDVIGRSGLEKIFNSQLRGISGGMQLEVNSRGRIIQILGYKPPLAGKDLHLTLDIKLQDFIYSLLQGTKGAIGVMNAQNGEILALCSSPSFDPNIFTDKEQHGKIESVLKDKFAPLLNRNLQVYPTGSIFKIVTAYAGLVNNHIRVKESLECQGELQMGNTTFNCWLKRGHGALSMENAIATSCNVFFYKLGLRVGEQELASYAKEFGFGQVTGIELEDESAGIVPSAKWKNTNLHQKWYPGDTLNFAIGQGYLLVSPLQALRMVAMVANGGGQIFPHLVKRENYENKKIFSPQILEVIQNGMKKVVAAEYGTGQRVFVEGAEVFAKTGTAQVKGALSHAWIVGFTKFSDNNICFVVFLEHGGHGGERAAELAKQIVLYLRKAN